MRLLIENAVLSYERICTEVQLAAGSRPFACGVVSAIRGEGTTTVAERLARTMARVSDKKVALVDADFANPEVHERFGVPLEAGFADLVANGTRVPLVTKETEYVNLSVVTAGKDSESAFSLFSLEKMPESVRELRSSFDYVFFDCPAVLADSSVAALAAVLDGVLMLVKAGITQADMVEKALDYLGKASVIGVILNEVRPGRNSWVSRLP